jgi:hypothetical protein
MLFVGCLFPTVNGFAFPTPIVLWTSSRLGFAVGRMQGLCDAGPATPVLLISSYFDRRGRVFYPIGPRRISLLYSDDRHADFLKK